MLVLLALVPLISEAVHINECVPTCARIFRNSVTSILGNPKYSKAPLLAPIHEIIASSRNIKAAVRRINWTCSAMSRYERCLVGCQYSKAKSIRLVGNYHWTVVCDAVKTPNFTDYAQCQQTHQSNVRSRCGLLKLHSAVSLKSFCRKLQKYRTCYLQVPSNCSTAAYKFWKAVDDMLGEAHHQLLNVYSAPRRIPQQCRWKLSHFGRKHHKTKSPSTTTTDTTVPPTPVTGFDDELNDLIEAIDVLSTTCAPVVRPLAITAAPTTTTTPFSLLGSVHNFVSTLTSSSHRATSDATVQLVVLLCLFVACV